MADRLREAPAGSYGLCTANGGFITKHSMGIYANVPPAAGFQWADVQDEVDRAPTREAVAEHDGDVVIESWTVMHDRDGPTGERLAAVLLPDGRRAWGTTQDPDALKVLLTDDMIGRQVRLCADGSLTAERRPRHSACPSLFSGSQMQTRVPPPGLASTQMRPPWLAATRAQMARPMPVPGLCELAAPRLNMANTSSRSSGSMPTPLSATTISQPLPDLVAVTSTVGSLSPRNRMALDTRFWISWRSCVGLAVQLRHGPMVHRTPAAVRSAARSVTTSAATWSSATGTEESRGSTGQRVLEQVVDEARHPLDAALRRDAESDCLLAPVRVRLGDGEQQVEVAAHDDERRLQVMGHDRGELLEVVVRPLEVALRDTARSDAVCFNAASAEQRSTALTSISPTVRTRSTSCGDHSNSSRRASKPMKPTVASFATSGTKRIERTPSPNIAAAAAAPSSPPGGSSLDVGEVDDQCRPSSRARTAAPRGAARGSRCSPQAHRRPTTPRRAPRRGPGTPS